MKPQEVRRTLRMLWWLQLSVAVLPVCLVPAGLFSLGQYTERVSLLFFVLALSLLFLNAKPFQRFKHAVIMVGQVRETAQEADALRAFNACALARLMVRLYSCMVGAVCESFRVGHAGCGAIDAGDSGFVLAVSDSKTVVITRFFALYCARCAFTKPLT